MVADHVPWCGRLAPNWTLWLTVLHRRRPRPRLDGKRVVFGEVVEGQELVDQIEALGSQSGAPEGTVEIAASGVVGGQ